LTDEHHLPTVPTGTYVARTSAVTVRYRGNDGTPAVRAASIGVRVGEIVGVVGESGSGKTSLAMALAGLSHHTGGRVEGEIDVLGSDIASAGRAELRRLRAEVQVVFQSPHASLDPRQSVRRGLRELRAIQRERTNWITDEELMDRVHLAPELLARYPHQLSGGQAQRVCIARALLVRPSVLIADEPTSGLDVSVQARVLSLLGELRDRDGVSILFISHDLNVVRMLCDRVYVMRSGEVVETGDTHRVLTDPHADYTKALLAASPGRRLRPPSVAGAPA
jgi:ABC-type glutathione transport system ATPase component